MLLQLCFILIGFIYTEDSLNSTFNIVGYYIGKGIPPWVKTPRLVILKSFHVHNQQLQQK